MYIVTLVVPYSPYLAIVFGATVILAIIYLARWIFWLITSLGN
mgnify:CR=1 FL=1